MQSANIAKHPAWYGSVMGTGIIAIAIMSVAAASWLSESLARVIAAVFLVIATVLALVLAPRYLRRLAPGNRDALRAELADPAAGALLGTFPGGLLVLAVAWPRVFAAPWGDPVLWVGLVLAILGTVGSVAVGLAWAIGIVGTPEPRLQAVNGGWFIPPVVNVIVPLAFVPTAAILPASWASTVFAIGAAFWGTGILLFIVVLALLIARMALTEPAPAMMAASQWIPLAPAGIAGVALLRLIQEGELVGLLPDVLLPAAAITATMLAGFGMWWTLLAVWLLNRHLASGPLPYHPGWWGFTFPLGAMTVSLALLASYWDSALFLLLALLWGAALLFAWTVVGYRSLRAVQAAKATPAAPATQG